MTDSRYLTVEKAAARFNASIFSIWRCKRTGKFPKAKKLGPGVTRWLIDDIEEWEAGLEMCLVLALEPSSSDPFDGRA